MVAGSSTSLRRPNLRGNHAEIPEDSSTRAPSRTRDESAKRFRIPSITDHERLNKRRKVINDIKAPQLKIPLRGRKLVSPRIVTQSLPAQSQLTPPLDSPKTQYDQIRRIEERARVSIRGGVLNLQDDKRSLRSKDGGSRSKSELAQYFENYEQLLSLEPAPPEPLSESTKIVIIDDIPGFEPLRHKNAPDPFGASKPLHNARKVDFSHVSVKARQHISDPLGPDYFNRTHKKEERREKQIRNNEKEKAQHEKYQLERLLNELRGPDWLRTMGISGITDTEKKKYEPKRTHLVQGIKIMIDKYERWKVKEKKQRQRELEISQADEAESSEDADDEDDSNEEEEEEEVESATAVSASPERDLKSESNDVDSLAARQLQLEASSAHKRRKRPAEPPPPPPPAYEPFVSFYHKRHLRDAALGSHGRRSKGVSAFGQPVPELEDVEFELPDDILTDDAIRAGQRRRRLLKRSTD